MNKQYQPKYILLLVSIWFGSAYQNLPAAPVVTERAGLIGDGIAWFLPEGLDSGTLPSLALVAEPEEAGPLPEAWKLAPEFSTEDGLFKAVVALPSQSDLYGTGEVTGPLRRNGTSTILWNTDNFGYLKYDGLRLYQSHPWIMGLRPDGSSFGILFDTTWRATLTATDEQVIFASEGPAFRVIVIDRESPQQVIAALADLTGHMPLPPLWALGFQQCKYSYFPDARVREIAGEFRSRDIPCDVIWMDIDYMDGFRVFTFDPERFPDPAATNAWLHERDFKAVWMIDPGIKREAGYSIYDSGTANDVWVRVPADDENPENAFVGNVWPGPCVFPDFTMPATRVWWGDLYQDFMANGIDGVWNDMNEPAVFNGPGYTIPVEAPHRGGDLPAGPHLRYHNVYGMLMVRATREGILTAQPDRRPFVLTRANYLGGHRYAASWTGDNLARMEHLKLSIPMILNIGLSGQPFTGADIGGFGEEPSPELYGHWIALGAFYPFSRAHAANDTPGNEPWRYGKKIEEVSRVALSRRYRLLPYIYTCMQQASFTGSPLMQPLFMADSRDLALRDEQESFLFGPDLLVIPQWAADGDLPKGEWRPVQLLEGDREEDGFQPELRIRPGAIVPIGKAVQNTTQPLLDPLTLLVSLDSNGKAEGVLYEDAGDGFGVCVRTLPPYTKAKPGGRLGG